jgi:hypothetical protein
MIVQTFIKRAWILCGWIVFPTLVWGWGDGHRVITQAALDAVPERERWIAVLGADHWQHIAGLGEATGYAGIADNQSEFIRRSWGAYFANDYLLTREVPFLHGYHVPVIEQPPWNRQISGFAKRALQALRTESPREAARRVGVLIHFIEDAGATAHAARISPPAHTLLDNTVFLERIRLPGYTPVLLGGNDEEFITTLQERIAALIDRSRPVGERLKPKAVELAPLYGTLRAGLSPNREFFDAISEAQIEPALDCGRLVADAVHTLMTLGLGQSLEGATLSGRVRWGSLSAYEESGAEVHLLKSGSGAAANLFEACTIYNTHTDQHGAFSFHGLPSGRFRILAYRVGSSLVISEPENLSTAASASVEIDLPPSQTPGNLVYNPELTLSTYQPQQPDRWMELAPLADGRRVLMNAPVPVEGGKSFRIGAKIRDPAARVLFHLLPRSGKAAIQDCSRTMKIDPAFPVTKVFAGEGGEATVKAESPGVNYFLIVIETPQAVTEAVEDLWVVPVAAE